MRLILMCRRTSISLIGILCLTALGIHNSIDVSLAIAGICASLSSANAWQARADVGKDAAPQENPVYK